MKRLIILLLLCGCQTVECKYNGIKYNGADTGVIRKVVENCQISPKKINRGDPCPEGDWCFIDK